MTWDWFPFLVGAPVWASVGIILFASLAAASARSARRSKRLDAVAAHRRRIDDDPEVVSLTAYRLRRLRGHGAAWEGVDKGRSRGVAHTQDTIAPPRYGDSRSKSTTYVPQPTTLFEGKGP